MTTINCNFMKFSATPYHQHLLRDWERLSAFYEEIKTLSRGVIFDLGTGSGILSYFAASNMDAIYSLELDPKAAASAGLNLKNWENIHIINADAREYNFPCQADLIICEMLDTALIDEEQVPVMNHALDYLGIGGHVIPAGVINGAELVDMEMPQISYEDFSNHNLPPYQLRSSMVIYNSLSFYQKNNAEFSENINFKIKESGRVNAIKITMFTLISKNLLCGPTPMFNPPLFIPINEINLKKEDQVKINLRYTMGGGLDTIKTRIEEIL